MINETLTIIRNRRSTRIFLRDQLKDEEVKAIIEAAIYAPSGHNKQPWHFSVIQKKEILDELNINTKELAKTFDDEIIKKMGSNEKFNIFYNAPTVIIVSGGKEGLTTDADCAAATQNMLIAAESIGVGSCWVGMVSLLFRGPEGSKYREQLGIPEGYAPYYAVALGYKKLTTAKAPERKENTVNYIK